MEKRARLKIAVHSKKYAMETLETLTIGVQSTFLVLYGLRHGMSTRALRATKSMVPDVVDRQTESARELLVLQEELDIVLGC